MLASTKWLAPANTGTGLDHLATQAPSTRMYIELVPGITNVTERAAYFSFYPWLFWAWERRASAKSLSFEQLVRRGEVLFTLIAERHARHLDEDDALHGLAMVGRSKLVPALRGLADADEISVARFAAIEGSMPDASPYFQNRLGGLAQYNLGPLRELGVLATSQGRHGYTPERGAHIAAQLAKRAPEKLFFDALEHGVTSPAELDAMAELCPCHMPSNQGEVDALLDLLLDRKNEQGEGAERRRDSMVLMLDLLAHTAPGIFRLTGQRWCRSSAYAGAWSVGQAWVLPLRLERLRRRWAAYERHELFSIALQTLFWTALHLVANASGKMKNVDAIVDAVGDLARATFGAEAGGSLRSAIKERTSALPAIVDWETPAHESSLADKAILSARDDNPGSALEAAIDILFALYARKIPDEPYVDFRFEHGYFLDYPLELRRFRATVEERAEATLVDFVRHLVADWAINAHFRVALRKLHGEGLDTFRLRPLDDEMLWVASPQPTWTNPRLQNVERFLVDLGLATWQSNGPSTLTAAGHAVLEAHRG